MLIPVTALYGALNAILNIGLAANVSRNRAKHNVSLGSGQSNEMEIAMRAHGNNAEFVPLGLVMLLIAELSGGSSLWLHVLGGSLFLGRVLHPIGMPLKAPNPPRFIGTTLTWVMIVATAAYCLVLRYR
ncbi:MAG: MAPEG family protein [Polyangiaceae bacterium]|nr:MAPEG family protein [Polyangiaceae bacterium]